MSVDVIKPPTPFSDLPEDRPVIFLAGSIEMGNAEPWQDEVIESLTAYNAVLLNPRRDDWDASWEQDISNVEFRGQVEWELSGLERADFVIMYFAAGTKSPITLLELGLCARTSNLIVCCPSGFWRRGNVQVVCSRFNIELVDTLEDLISSVRERVDAFFE